MKTLFALTLLVATGCASMSPGSRKISSEWQNKLTCDDGVRIDENETVTFQMVLFGDAARHFVEAGAYGYDRLNPAGEYVQQLQADRYEFHAVLHDGLLTMSDLIDRTQSDYTVTWRPYSNGPSQGTNFVFHRCH